MKVNKIPIAIDLIPQWVEKIKKDIDEGAPFLGNLRFIFLLEEDKIVYCYTPFDFIDNYSEDVKFKTFIVYQVLEN